MVDLARLAEHEHATGVAGPIHAPAAPVPDPELSVVVPVHNEAENIRPLIDETVRALDGVAAFEIVYVDDCSSDATPEALAAARQSAPMLRVLRHAQPMGQSAAVTSGVLAARGQWIATLDGDGQNDPADIPRLLERARELAQARGEDAVLIAGWRNQRRDSWYTRTQSRLANGVRSRLLHDGTPDTGCGLKLYSRALFLRLPNFDHMHRFMPALAQRAGAGVQSVPVNHRPRTRGRSHYGMLNRLWAGVVDTAGVMWLARRARRPDALEVGLEAAAVQQAPPDAAARAPAAAHEAPRSAAPGA